MALLPPHHWHLCYGILYPPPFHRHSANGGHVDLPIKPLKHACGVDTEEGGDHAAIASAYTSYARRLNLESSKQMRVFSELVHNLSLFLGDSFFGLNHLRFYLPEMYLKLHEILFLDDDILWFSGIS
ncbi:hypothetical protein ZIOFF_013773 [Zingiber officinale]|uniref:Hexosyltransferase n=1 Tax=Zingiber officinale TaxID=94328 RepID=A0A8J5HG99_ZINOF|nr:hypothetical protein ZIOFF_013773 [Zingiber officinale]